MREETNLLLRQNNDLKEQVKTLTNKEEETANKRLQYQTLLTTTQTKLQEKEKDLLRKQGEVDSLIQENKLLKKQLEGLTNKPGEIVPRTVQITVAIKTFSELFNQYLTGITTKYIKPRRKTAFIYCLTLFVFVIGLLLYSRARNPPLFFTGNYGKELNVYSYDSKISNIMRATEGFDNWSPTTDCVLITYFTSNQSGKTEIYGFNTFTGEGPRQITHTSGAHESWSPTTDCLGGNIYFTSNESGKTEIYGFNTFTGEGPRQITHTSGAHESWSPTTDCLGGNIYFTSNQSGKTEIYRFNTFTGEGPGRLHIRLELMKVGHPTTDCLGGNIYFTSNQSGKTEIYRFNTFTGEGARQMTYTFGAHESWSPVIRGHNIYFTSNRSGVTQIYRLTRNEVAITDFESWDREIN